MRTEEAKRYARDRYIDELIRDRGVNETITTVAWALQCTVHGAAQIVMPRARAVAKAAALGPTRSAAA